MNTDSDLKTFDEWKINKIINRINEIVGGSSQETLKIKIKIGCRFQKFTDDNKTYLQKGVFKTFIIQDVVVAREYLEVKILVKIISPEEKLLLNSIRNSLINQEMDTTKADKVIELFKQNGFNNENALGELNHVKLKKIKIVSYGDRVRILRSCGPYKKDYKIV